MSTKLAVTVVGAVVGAYFGYPQLGAMAGALIGSAIDPTVIQGPKINESGNQTVAEGVPRPIIFGTAPCTGNVIQRGPLIIREVSESQGKGSTKTKTERAYRTYAIGICEGPMATVLRVWRNKKLVYDVRHGSGMLAESAKWLENKRFYMGDESQLPDPDLEFLDADATAHRGTVYMVAIDDDLTDMQGSIPQYEFEVAEETVAPEIGDITDSITGPGTTWLQWIYRKSDGSLGLGYQTSTVSIPGGQFFLRSYASDLSTVSTQTVTMQDMSMSGLATIPSNFRPVGPCDAYVFGYGTSSFDPDIITGGGSYVGSLRPTGLPIYWFGTSGTPNTQSDARRVWASDTRLFVGVTTRASTTQNCIYMWPGGSAGLDTPASATATGICDTPGAEFYMTVDRDGSLYVLKDNDDLLHYSDTLTLLDTVSLPFTTASCHGIGVDTAGDFAVFAYSAPTAKLEIRKMSDWSLVKTISGAPFSLTTGTRCIFTDDSLYIQCTDNLLGAEIVRISYQASALGQPTTLADIVSSLYQRCGVRALQFDVSELTDLVKGYPLASAGYTAADAVDATRLGYFFDKCVRDKKIYHPKRGKAVAKTLTYLDLTSAADNNRREQANEIPYKLNVRYPNPDSGYAVLKETTGSISPDRRTTGEVTLDVPVCLSSDEAAQIADKQYKVTLAEMDGTMELPVMLDVALDLAEGDCIGYVDRLGQTYRLRIEQMEFADWAIKLTCKADRQSAYTSNVTGIPAPEPTLPPSTIVGDTVFAIIDGPARTDAEDQLGMLAAVTGPLPPWYAAELQRSFDGGANYTEAAQFLGADIIGVLIEALPAASPYYTDTTNTVKVQLYRDGQVINDLTEVQFLTGQGVFALQNPDGSWEYMQGRDVTDEGSNVFHLSTLHRGLLNTDSSQGHTTGLKFVWLPDATFLAASSAWLGLDLTHRAVSYDQAEDEVTNDETRTYYGESQREWPVEFLTLDRDMSDVVSGTWVPRARFGSPMNPVQSSNFQGFRVTVDDGSSSVSFDVTTASFTYDASAMSSPVTVSVSALNRITGAGPAVSETV